MRNEARSVLFSDPNRFNVELVLVPVEVDGAEGAGVDARDKAVWNDAVAESGMVCAMDDRASTGSFSRIDSARKGSWS